MNNYGYEFASVKHLSDIDCCQVRHYKFNKIDFLVKPKPGARRLLVTFHGIARGSDGAVQVPIFRGYNWDYPSTNMLCMSDRLLELYVGKADLAWFLSTREHAFISIYSSVIEHVSAALDVDEIIFFGTSGGGYPSIILASLFSARCIVANAQIYLERYGEHLTRLAAAVAADGDVLVGTSMEEVLKKEGFPKKMQVFQNRADNHHYFEHFLPFKRFCEEEGIKTAKFVEFDTPVLQEGGDPHGVSFPLVLG